MQYGIILMFGIMILFVIPLDARASEMAPVAPDTFEQSTINGVGATFPFPLIDLWRVEYNKQYPGINLNYQSIGSGGGIKQHIEKTVNFAATDKPLKIAEAKLAPETLHIPEAIGGIVIAYNLPNIPEKGLMLTGQNIVDIYLGKITKWNDPALVINNPQFTLPDAQIIVAHRSDGSGTTFVFTDYLSSVSSEFYDHIGIGKSVPWGNIPNGQATLVAAAGNEGVSGIIRSTDYSIGYIELAYAFQTGISFAYVQNADGTAFVEPTLDSIFAASEELVKGGLPTAEGDWSSISMVNVPGANSYPIASFTYLLVYKNLENSVKSFKEAKIVVHMIHWMITEGQKYSESLLYVPLPYEIIEIGKQGLAQVKYDSNIIWDYQIQSDDKKYVIPSWIKNNAKWWADGLITDKEYIDGLRFLISNGVLKI